MKFVMNGCLIIGTMDGANVEIAEEVGEENMFAFGMNVNEVKAAGEKMRSGFRDYVSERLKRVYNEILAGTFTKNGDFDNLINNLINGGDHYLNSHDFESYCQANVKVDETY